MRLISLIIGTLLLFFAFACTSQVRQDSTSSPGKIDPSFSKWASIDIVNAFEEYGLEVEAIQTGFVVGVHRESENTIFMMPSFGKEIGGLVSGFGSANALKQSEEHYSEMNNDTEQPVWWIFKKDNIIVLISGRIPEFVARQYKKVFNSMQTN